MTSIFEYISCTSSRGPHLKSRMRACLINSIKIWYKFIISMTHTDLHEKATANSWRQLLYEVTLQLTCVTMTLIDTHPINRTVFKSWHIVLYGFQKGSFVKYDFSRGRASMSSPPTHLHLALKETFLLNYW